MSASSIRRRMLHRGLRARVPLYRIPLTANHRQLCLQWAHESRAWQADWHQVVFSNESRLNLGDHNGHIRDRRYDGERCLPECVIERHSDLHPELWFGVSLEISFRRIMHAHMLQRLFETSVHATTSSLSCLFAEYVAYGAHVGFCWLASRS
ncbi:transposable element Tcb1 transposase [Trichonephila clavipes]|nr:transposable element Tcb1 transposase [Trichonephila clavipes]